MSVVSTSSIAADINSMRQNYDTSNPVVAEIIRAKEQRLKILQELNKQQQEELNSLKLESELIEELKKKNKPTQYKKKEKTETKSPISLRRSARLSNSPNVAYREHGDYKPEIIRPSIERPPNDYGPTPGIEIGFHWETRLECSMYGVHRPTVAGIHGGPDGAYSIALSGGYPEDIDEGEYFIYTGAGGRDLKGTATNPKNLRTAPQTKDQQLEGTNLSLVKSIKSKLPIRVIRGYKSPSIFAPETGYRYDGLYQVVDYWEDVGKTGHRIYRFRMERIKDQAPPPWESSENKPQVKKSVFEDSKTNGEMASSENNDGESKENVDPFQSNANMNRNVSDKLVKDIDNQIKTCISFFEQYGSIDKCDLKNNSDEENFYGWDST